MYEKNMSVDTTDKVEKKNGLSYLPWAAAYALAGRPKFEHPVFRGRPYRELLGGAVVAADMGSQRVWLPVLDNSNRPVPADKLDARDVSDALNRALVKAIAVNLGVGMSLYAGYDGDGKKLAAQFAAIQPGTTDLSQVEPVVEKKGQTADFIPWWAAVVAGKLADPDGFLWEVVEFPAEDEETLPYLETEGGVLVAVDITFAGRRHRQWLPVMDARSNAKRSSDVDVADWNKAVMRALAKGMAVVSGYGLSAYAKETSGPSQDKAGAAGKPGRASVAAKSAKAVQAEPQLDQLSPDQAALVKKILARIEAGADPAAVRNYINTPTVLLDPDAKAIITAALDRSAADCTTDDLIV